MEESVTAKTLLSWRLTMLNEGGEASALDWLLDLKGGLRWQQLQALRLYPESTLTLEHGLETLEELWRRHLRQQIPLQYLVGLCPWRDLELKVAPGVLIPRQETELLIDLALGCLNGEDRQGDLHWADLGTGSGCIAIGLAKALPGSQGVAVDRSSEALAQAQANAEAILGSGGLAFAQGDWWEAIPDRRGKLDLVVSNPPYIPAAIWADLEPVVRDHEPELALNGGSDGLDAIRAIAGGACAALKPGGWLVLEHHYDQSNAVLELLDRAGLVNGRAHSDLEGVQRFAIAQRPKATEED